MSAWLKRFGLHLAAAVGATGVFVAAAAVGASQTRQQEQVVAISSPVPRPARTRTPVVVRRPSPTPTPSGEAPQAVPKPAARPSARPSPAKTATPTAERVIAERSLAGRVKNVQPDAIDVTGVGGREWHVVPAPGALIRLNGKTARLDSLQPGDGVVILGQAQPGPGLRFLAHAITAKSR